MDREKIPMFENWLKSSLRDRYDDTLDEPLPQELSELLSQVVEPRNTH